MALTIFLKVKLKWNLNPWMGALIRQPEFFLISKRKLESFINGKLILEHTLAEEVSGRIGLWSKADSVVYFDNFKVTEKIIH